MKTTFIAVRLALAHGVMRELLRLLRRALPIAAGVAGPMALFALAALACIGYAPLRAASLPWPEAAPVWLCQSSVAAWPAWALRRRLLPADWCLHLRCLPLRARSLWAGDMAVSATLLAPLALLYLCSILLFAALGPAWWRPVWPWAVASLLASWFVSCVLGALALVCQRQAVQMRVQGTRDARMQTGPTAQAALAARALLARQPGGLGKALVWLPWWRAALRPALRSVAAAMLLAFAFSWLCLIGLRSAVPATLWALVFCSGLVALTERLQSALQAHLAALAPWLAAWPATRAWRWHARALVCAPMMITGLACVAIVLARGAWRGLPLAGFVFGLLLTPLLLAALPASARETRVGLWFVCIGWLTAFGSELWN